MKKLLLLSLALLFILPMTTKAQMTAKENKETGVYLPQIDTLPLLLSASPKKPNKHELRLGGALGGVPILYGILSGRVRFIFFPFSLLTGERTQSKSKFYDSPNLTYFYRHNRRMSFGVSLTYGKANRIEDVYKRSYDKKIRTYNTNSHFFSFLAELQVTYLKRSVVELYGSLGLGGTLVHTNTKTKNMEEQTIGGDEETSKNNFIVMASISPIGIKVGKNVGGFLELGVGAKGLINAGVFVNF